jgi:hypothetical protein
MKGCVIMRSRAYNRDISYRKAIRKRRLDRECFRYSPYYTNLHQYSKNKIHCSCPMCSRKTKNKGRKRLRHGNYDKSISYKMSDLKTQLSMDDHVYELTGKKFKRKRQKW